MKWRDWLPWPFNPARTATEMVFKWLVVPWLTFLLAFLFTGVFLGRVFGIGCDVFKCD